MNKKSILISGAFIAIAASASLLQSPHSAFAASSSSGTATTTAAIACVGKVVATREAAFDSAESAYQTAENAAYTTRAKALAQSYATGTTAGVASGIKAAWSTFDASIKTASTAWASKRLTIWSTFKTSAAACKAPSGVVDSSS